MPRVYLNGTQLDNLCSQCGALEQAKVIVKVRYGPQTNGDNPLYLCLECLRRRGNSMRKLMRLSTFS